LEDALRILGCRGVGRDAEFDRAGNPHLTGLEIPRLQEKAGFCIFEKH
jgi:hypothetical protein